VADRIIEQTFLGIYQKLDKFPYGNLKYVGGDINTTKEFL